MRAVAGLSATCTDIGSRTYGFGLLAWLARWHHFVLSDGRISIARSFVPDDWRRLISAAGLSEDDVVITWHVPFRLCVARHCPNR